tara:strand:+ start:13614 stop:13820 length:207 start_codon:yes stop_codon:yes gene_type:complete
MTKRQRGMQRQLAKTITDLKYNISDRRWVGSTRGIKFAKRKHNKAFRRFNKSLACEGTIAPELARFRY